MAFTIEQSILIDAPAEDVWEYVANEGGWRRPFVTKVEPLDEGPPAPGSSHADSFEIAGPKGTVINEVTAVERPTYLAWSQPRGQGGPVRGIEDAYILDERNGKTRFTLTNTYEGNGLWQLAMPIMRLQVSRTVYRQMLKQLKENVERRTGER